ncbi:MAG: SDR family NAD(P)-dependent oxidoreductase [Sphingobium sp.]
MAFAELADRVVIVTGGGGGIGRAICLRLALEGCGVAILDRDAAGAEDTAATVKGRGGRALAIEVDISDHGGVGHAVRMVEDQLGPIHGLVNNAGWDRLVRFVDSDPALWRQLIDVNFIGYLNLHHAVLPRMVSRRAGRIVNIASDAGRVGSSMESVYSACKGGLIAFSKTIAREHARDGICVNSVCPGPTDTPLLRQMSETAEQGERLVASLEKAIPLRRLGQPEDYPGIVAFLLSDDAAFITGQTISVSGGLVM